MANRKNNARRRETRRRIEEAFVRLVEAGGDPAKVTVTELCRVAGVNRSTFYANYNDVQALARVVVEREELPFTTVVDGERALALDEYDFSTVFERIASNQPFYRMYFRLGLDRANSVAYNEQDACARFDRHHDYHVEFFRAGITAIIKIWLERGCQESPEEMAGILQEEYGGVSFRQV